MSFLKVLSYYSGINFASNGAWDVHKVVSSDNNACATPSIALILSIRDMQGRALYGFQQSSAGSLQRSSYRENLQIRRKMTFREISDLRCPLSK